MPFDATAHTSADLPAAHLRLAVHDLLRERRADGFRLALGDLQERLWREPPDRVRRAYDAALVGTYEGPAHPAGRHGLRAHVMRQLRRPLPSRDKQGLRLPKMAARAGLDVATLTTLLEHHGYLAAVPFGGRQRRRLVTDRAYAAGLGHNPDGARRRLRAEGAGKPVPFPRVL